MGRIRGTKKIRRVFTGAREYYAYDLDEDVFGKVKRIYGNTEEEVREKIQKYEEERQKVLSTRKPKSKKLWNYILFYFKGAVGKKAAKELKRLMELCEDLIKDSAIDKDIDTITEEEMQNFYDELAEKYSLTNVKEIDTVLRKTFTLSDDLVIAFDFENIIIPEQDILTISYILTPKEYTKLFDFLLNTDRFTLYTKLVIVLLLATGMTYEEVSTINRNGVDLEGGVIRNKVNEWKLPDELIKWLKKEAELGNFSLEGNELAFSKNGKKIATYQTLQSTLGRVISACGIPRGVTVRSLRTSFINYKMQSGATTEELAEIMHISETAVKEMWDEIQFKKQFY